MIRIKNRVASERFSGLFRWVQDLKPPGFQGQTLYNVVQFVKRQFDMQSFFERTAAISYNFIMAIPPMCLFLFTLIPNLPFISKSAMKFQLHSLIRDIIPAQTYNRQLINFVDSFIDGSKIGILSFAFLISLFFASNAIIGLMRSFNKRGYIGFERINGLKQRWIAVKLTLILFGLLLGTLISLFLQHKILRWIGIRDEFVASLILFGRWIVIAALIFFSFAFIYRYAPSTTRRWHLFSPGAMFATLFSIVVTLGFSIFVSNFSRYNILYGSIGSVMVVMIMIYLNSLAAFLGFILNLSIHSLETEDALIERDSL